MQQQVDILVKLSFSIDAEKDEESIGVYIREGILHGFPEQMPLVPADKIIDIIDIKQEAEIYQSNAPITKESNAKGMFAITYKEKPITLDKLYKLENSTTSAGYRAASDIALNGFLTSNTKRDCAALYLHYFGFTWEERTKGIEATRIKI